MNEGLPRQLLDPRQVVRGFDRAATRYRREARFQAEVRRQLLERLALLRLDARCVLDLGSGSVSPRRELRRHCPRARLLAVDFSLGMLAEMAPRWPFLRRRFVRICADAHRLPLVDASMDLIFSNLMLQWSNAPAAVFAEVCRVLRPGGAFLFSTFGPETLQELRVAWQQADRGVHVHDFVDMQTLAALLSQAGLVEVVLDRDMVVRHFPDCQALMRELRRLGSANRAQNRPAGLGGRKALSRMVATYEQLREPQGLPASHEVLYGVAWRPLAGGGGAGTSGGEAGGGEQRIPLGRLREDLRRGRS